MRNSNKLMYTATYNAVPIHADLQLTRKPRVAAHTPLQNPNMWTYNLQGPLTRDIWTNSLQRSRVWLPTCPQVLKFAIGAGDSQRTCTAIS